MRPRGLQGRLPQLQFSFLLRQVFMQFVFSVPYRSEQKAMQSFRAQASFSDEAGFENWPERLSGLGEVVNAEERLGLVSRRPRTSKADVVGAARMIRSPFLVSGPLYSRCKLLPERGASKIAHFGSTICLPPRWNGGRRAMLIVDGSCVGYPDCSRPCRLGVMRLSSVVARSQH
jgi:hypothetical protein